MVKLKKIMATTAIAGAFCLTPLGLGAGLANAAPCYGPAYVCHGHWGGGWHGPRYGPGYGYRGLGYGYRPGYGPGPGYGYGPGPGYGYGRGINACISATGPWGYVSGSVCI